MAGTPTSLTFKQPARGPRSPPHSGPHAHPDEQCNWPDESECVGLVEEYFVSIKAGGEIRIVSFRAKACISCHGSSVKAVLAAVMGPWICKPPVRSARLQESPAQHCI